MTLLRLLVLTLLLSLAAPLVAQEAAEAPDGPISAEADATLDAQIAVRIREILGALGGYEDVTVAVNDGIVRLRGTTNSLAEAEALDALVSRIEGVVAIRNEVVETAEIGRRLDPAIERFEARFWQLVTFLPLMLIAGAVFAIIAFLGLLLARRHALWNRLAPNAFIASLYSQLALLVFIVIGVVAALDILNASALLGTILGAAGIFGLAIGFAVRDTVENYIASIMLSIRQPFRPNDLVEIEGDTGKVIRLTSRATILLSLDGNHIRIPNATVFKSRIVNYTQNAERRFQFEIGVASDADLAKVRKLAESVVIDLPFTLSQPEPLVWIDRIGDGAIFLTVTGWIDQRKSSLPRARGEALRQVKNAIEAAGVEVPDTTYRVQMLGAGKGIVTESADAPAAPPASAPAALEEVADVGTDSEAALDRLIHEERAEGGTRDLLDEDGKRE